MTHPDPPVRLAQDPTAPEGLRALVSQARTELPNPDVLAAFVGRVTSTISAESLPSNTTPHQWGQNLASSVTGKLLVFAVLSGLGVAGVSILGSGSRANVPARSASSSKEPEVKAGEPSTPPLGVVPQSSSQPAIVESAQATQLPSGALKTARTAPSVEVLGKSNGPKTEAAILESARVALKTDPKRALELTQEHAKRYPSGLLRQEREVIAIEALNRLGKHDTAKARGANFGDAFPDSAHQPRLEQSLKSK